MTSGTAVELGTMSEAPVSVKELEDLLNSQDFIDSYVRVQVALSFGEVRVDELNLEQLSESKRNEIESLRAELAERRMDQDLALALSAWGKSPSPLRGNGSIDLGFNAGIVHYFEYRAVIGKAYRSGLNDAPTIQGFINYTAMLKTLLHSANPLQNTELAVAAWVADRRGTGKRKITVLSKEGLFVVGFQQSPFRPLRIITAIPDTSSGSFIMSLNKDLEGSSNSQKRLNRLGDNRVLLCFARGKQPPQLNKKYRSFCCPCLH